MWETGGIQPWGGHEGSQVSQGRPHPQHSLWPTSPTLVWELGGWGSRSPGLTGWRTLGRFLRCWGLSSEGTCGPQCTEELTSKGNEVQRLQGAASALHSTLVTGPSSPCWAGPHEEGRKASPVLPLAPWISLGSVTLQPHLLLQSLPEAPPPLLKGPSWLFSLRAAPPHTLFLKSTESAEAVGGSPRRAPGHLRALGCDSGD